MIRIDPLSGAAATPGANLTSGYSVLCNFCVVIFAAPR
jgi:hypothetical protein